jgi:NADPH:quinone reductase-like Zn-dependent oxidoreductase
MKAIVKDRYGSPDVLRIEDVVRPEPNEEQVLVRVHASSVNAHDWHMLRGKPYVARLSEGLRRPKSPSLGLDVAGVVEAVGAAVSHVAPGDRVFGSRSGAFAEYVAGKVMVPMPENMTFEQAAAVPTAGLTALQGLRDKGGIRSGQRVLIIGAGGGVGSMAVQIAKSFEAEVTATTSPKTLEVVRSLGADQVIDHTAEDVTRMGRRYDLVLDIGGTLSLSRIAGVLTDEGRLVMVAPGAGQWAGPIVRVLGGLIRSRFGTRQLRAFLATPNREDLLVLKELIEGGKLRPVVDRTFPFEEIPEAIRHVESGRASGKVVISIA